MRKTLDSCLAAFMGYAALKAFGHDDYAGAYFSGLTASFAAADLLKASLGNKEIINSNDFSSPSVALISATTASVSAYALTVGAEQFNALVPNLLSATVWLGVSTCGVKVLKDRLTKPQEATEASLPTLKP